MNPDADDLLLFARVAESGSFSRAAERVRLPKSTVSRRIAALEQRLGERLLQRTTRKLVITDFGQGVLDHARVLSEEVDAALAFALSRQERPGGRLRVSMPGNFASTVIEAPLADFVRRYPDIALEIDLSPRRVDLIGENFDLAIRMGELGNDPQLAARRLTTFTTGLYASPGLLREHGEPTTPEALATLRGLMLLTRSGDTLPWQLSRRAQVPAPPGADMVQAALVITPQRQLRANSPDLLIRMARQGAGVAAVSDLFAEPWLARGELQRVLPDWQLPEISAWAVFPGRRLMPAKTRLFLDMLARVLAPCSEASAEAAGVGAGANRAAAAAAIGGAA